MSGHSKWSTIKRKKGANDAKRSKIFTQLIRELVIAAKGGGDPASNPRLRLAVEKARGQNMPKANIDKAIKRGTGELEGVNYDEIRYEGYGPGGTAVIVDTLTDNRNRTVGEVRHLFAKCGGNLGENGCVSYLFEKTGLLLFDPDTVDRDAVMEAAIEADASDVIDDVDLLEVQTSPADFERVRDLLEGRGFAPTSAEVTMRPSTTVELEGKAAQSMLRLMEALDEHDDVKEVYANFDISDEEMSRASGDG
jgi:YebC/PmpR family DNA-binding regulatory protein